MITMAIISTSTIKVGKLFIGNYNMISSKPIKTK